MIRIQSTGQIYNVHNTNTCINPARIPVDGQIYMVHSSGDVFRIVKEQGSSNETKIYVGRFPSLSNVPISLMGKAIRNVLQNLMR